MPNMPGAMTDTLEFMKNMWGGITLPGASMPGMVMPTLSVDEINKQIADLKAVESWLTLNMNMLHGSIKALEVQSATIATLQSMSANFTAAMKPHESAAAAQPAPFGTSFFKATEPAPAPAPPAPTPEPVAAASTAEVPQIANPAAWWTMLQEQFQQAVANAIPADGAGTADKPKAAKAPAAAKPVKKAAAAVKPATVRKT
ncbi:hypothetical protein GCM10022212_19760 [Actimicrobium antarcticum]|uniref:Tfp pilus assembly protein FimV n=2 Tax=Actimicrobium antarcticum TaxID=1051899 RepID=A0ABP7T8G4_9BURK